MHVADDVPPVRAEERPMYKKWLRVIGFLAPGEDEELWHAILRNWELFLKATSTRIIRSGAARRSCRARTPNDVRQSSKYFGIG